MLTTYTLTRLYTLVMPVATAKGCHIVEFRGVQNMKMHGQFTTSDPELQAALEAQPEYQSGVYRVTARIGDPPTAAATDSAAQPSKAPAKTAARKTQPQPLPLSSLT